MKINNSEVPSQRETTYGGIPQVSEVLDVTYLDLNAASIMSQSWPPD